MWDALYDAIGTNFTTSKNFIPRVDPLILDLDGDGIETVGTVAGVLFDHDADNIKTGTGWVGKDDGFLVWDKNNNGVINNGRELFGDAYLKSNGQLATDGFNALADLDVNQDGLVNASDAGFANLRVWQDGNQNGLTDAGELKTLAALNIVAFHTSATDHLQTLPNGNQVADIGHYDRTDGSTSSLASAYESVDVNLAQDTFHSEFADSVPIAADVAGLPTMQGSGRVRELMQAASIDTAEGNLLQTKLAAYSAMATRSAQQGAIDDLLLRWANTSDLKASMGQRNPKVTVVWSSPTQQAEWESKLHVLEAFNGRYFFTLPGETGTNASGISISSPDAFGKQTATINLNSGQTTLLQQSYDTLKSNVFQSLALQTRLKPYLDSIQLNVADTGLSFDFTALTSALQTKISANAANGVSDLVEFNRFSSAMLAGSGWNGWQLLETTLRSVSVTPALQSVFADWHIQLAGNTGYSGVGAGSDDVIVAGAANDSLQGGDGGDVLMGGQGADNLSGGSGDDVLDGGAGNDILAGDTGNNTYWFGKGDGQDTIQNTPYDNTLGRLNTLQLKAGITSSEVVLKQVYDSTAGGNNALEVSIAGSTDKITLNRVFLGYDTANIYNPLQQIKFADGTAWGLPEIQAKIFAGTVDADTLVGTVAADAISGQGGADVLDGRDGNDTLDGGAGNDTLTGGLGNNTYLFGKGDGQDLVHVAYVTPDKINTLQFKAGVAPSDIVLKQVYDNEMVYSSALEVSIAGTADKITFNGVFHLDDTATTYNSVQQFKFADGTTWSLSDIQAKLFAGTSGNDVLRGTIAGETLYGGVGNDQLNGAAGNDALNGGAGDDRLDGGTGNDTLDGSAGNDILNGGEGDDVYLFGKGDGQDVVQYSPNDGTGRLNTLQLKAGVVSAEVLLKQVYDGTFSGITGLEVSIAGSTDKVTLNSVFYGDDTANSYNPLQQIKFADGTSWTLSDIKNRLFAGTSGNDAVHGTTAADTLNGGLGDDNLNGAAGNDSVNGGDGADQLYGEAGDDVLNGGVGADRLDGGLGNDTLDGGAGNDTLSGDLGNNTVLFGKGDGQDLVHAIYDVTPGKLNTLQFKAGVASSEVLLKQVWDYDTNSSGGLEVSIAGTADKITLNGVFYANSTANIYNSVQQFKFADGTTWSLNDIQAKLFAGTAVAEVISGTLAADVIKGQAGADVLFGVDGDDNLSGGVDDDQLHGGNGNDTLDGGAGNDYLVGDAGNDTYLFGKGDGLDQVGPDYSNTPDRVNTLQFKTGVASSEVMLKQVYGNLEVSIVGTTDTITFSEVFDNDDTANLYNGLQQIKFADGTTWSLSTIESRLFAGTSGNDVVRGTTAANTLNGGAGDDSLNGAAGNDVLSGGAGNDTLIGDVGDDSLDGGAGNDRLGGGEGNDIYLFGKGDGQDTIDGDYDSMASKLNVLQFKPGVLASEILIKQSGYDLVLSIAGTTDQLTLTSFFYGEDWANFDSPVQQIKFADGTTWGLSTLKDKIYKGTDAADTIVGTVAADTIGGQAGADLLYGRAGNDTLNGGTGNDTLYGEDGADLLEGGAGDDSLVGGLGNDVYLFGKGDGKDVIGADYDLSPAKLNVLQFKAGVLPGDIVVSTSYPDLVLSIAGTTDQITLSGFISGGAAGDGANNPIQQVRFADGTVWGLNTLKDKIFAGTAAADTIYGTSMADVLSGQAGADALYGHEGNDVLRGGSGDDVLWGDEGNDTQSGDAGADHFYDNYGDDRYEYAAGDGADSIWDGSGTADVLALGSGITPGSVKLSLGSDGVGYQLAFANPADRISMEGIDQIAFQDGTVWTRAYIDSLDLSIDGTTNNDVLNGRVQSDRLFGLAGNDQINGLAGNDWLDGGSGVDTLTGGIGDDTYVVDDAGDVVVEGYAQGTDTVWASVNYTLAANVESLLLTGSAAINGSGNTLNNAITGNAAANVLSGGTGIDTLTGGAGDDTYVVDGATDVVVEKANEGTDWVQSSGNNFILGANVENLLLTGTAAINGTGNTLDNLLIGNGAANRLTGGAGNDTLDGGAGNDTLTGQDGDDTYRVDSILDVVSELSTSAGIDTIETTVSYTLANAVEVGVAIGNAAVSIVGNKLNNVLRGDANAAANTLSGGLGDDLYVVGANDVVVELAGEGTDRVQSSASLVLVANVEQGELLGSAASQLTGNALDNLLLGNAGNNRLDGGVGNDTLQGGGGANVFVFGPGSGHDTIQFATLVDAVAFAPGVGPADVSLVRSGNDLVASVGAAQDVLTVAGYFLPGGSLGTMVFGNGVVWNTAAMAGLLQGSGGTAGNDVLVGTSLDDTLLGLAGNDSLSGLLGNDVLDGGTGNDTMAGGLGNDTYMVDSSADVVTENTNEGTDTVQASATTTLNANVENLVLTGTSAINGTGNALNNTLTGNAANNRLDGGAGNDTMVGGLGNDSYVLDSTGDVLTEKPGEGADTVLTNLTYTLKSELENLTLTGTAAINGTGNAANNLLTGNVANNTLNGSTGADTMQGGLGDDAYVVDNAGDVVTENASEGIDTVRASVSWTLGANLEKLTLTDAAAINGTGNTLANALTGNTAANTLTGGAGNDTLVGGAGNDTYVFGRGDGADVVQENDAAAGNVDTFQFMSGILSNQVWLRHAGNNLELSLIGTTDKAILKDWYLGSNTHVEQFKTSNGATLLDSQVNALVSAMAAFAPPAAGQTTLPTDYQTVLNPVIAASWGP